MEAYEDEEEVDGDSEGYTERDLRMLVITSLSLLDPELRLYDRGLLFTGKNLNENELFSIASSNNISGGNGGL